MPQANSMFSRPRAISPMASESTLPCSAVRMRGEVLAVLVDQLAEVEHDLRRGATATSAATTAKASLAAATARSTSSTEAKSTVGLLLAGGRVPDRPRPARLARRRASRRSSGVIASSWD